MCIRPGFLLLSPGRGNLMLHRFISTGSADTHVYETYFLMNECHVGNPSPIAVLGLVAGPVVVLRSS